MGNDWDGAPPKASESQCTCEWAHADTGNSFYSSIVKIDPSCPVDGWRASHDDSESNDPGKSSEA